MGLAPFGDPGTFGDVVAKIVWVDDDLSVGVDLSFFGFPGFRGPYSRKFRDTFGRPREKGRGVPFEQNQKDVAAAFQKNLEECVLSIGCTRSSRS
jgi:carbamoyltransferase